MGRTLYVMGTVLAAALLVVSVIPDDSLSAEGSDGVIKAGFGCKMVNGQLVCGKKQRDDNDDDDDDDDDDDRPKKSKDKVIPKTCGKKVNCEAGLVKLEKPNKYGACCEARQGVCPTGFSGTPPKCTTCATVAAENGEAALDIFRNERPQCKGVNTICQKVVNGTSDCCCTSNP